MDCGMTYVTFLDSSRNTGPLFKGKHTGRTIERAREAEAEAPFEKNNIKFYVLCSTPALNLKCYTIRGTL